MDLEILEKIVAVADKTEYRSTQHLGEIVNSHSGFGGSYKVVFKDTKDNLSIVAGAAICHGGLSRFMNDTQVVAIVTRLYHPDKFKHPSRKPATVPFGWTDLSLLNKWYHWIANESCVRHAFITKDVDYMLEHGAVLDPNTPSGELMMACILTRVPSELQANRGRVLCLERLLAADIHPLLAAMVAYSVEYYFKGEQSYQFRNGVPTSAMVFRSSHSAHSHSPASLLLSRTKANWQALLTNTSILQEEVEAGRVERSRGQPFISTTNWGGVFACTGRRELTQTAYDTRLRNTLEKAFNVPLGTDPEEVFPKVIAVLKKFEQSMLGKTDEVENAA